MQEPIGFTWQAWYDGACGKYSLQHALLLLGIPITQKEANKGTGVPPWLTKLNGTNEVQIKEGLEYFGCWGIAYNTYDPDTAKQRIDDFLEMGCPVIICVEECDHWAVLAGKTNNGEYYWIDSADDNLIGCWKWEKILKWFDHEEYYIIGVKPRSKKQFKYSIVPKFRQIYDLLWEDDQLCEYWGYYLEDLNEIFDCPAEDEDALPANDFFRLHAKMILDATCYFYLYAEEKQMKWEMENYRKVACAHNLTISRKKLTQGIAKFSAALTCIACLDD